MKTELRQQGLLADDSSSSSESDSEDERQTKVDNTDQMETAEVENQVGEDIDTQNANPAALSLAGFEQIKLQDRVLLDGKKGAIVMHISDDGLFRVCLLFSASFFLFPSI